MNPRALREQLHLYACRADDIKAHVHTALTKDSVEQLADLVAELCLFLLVELGEQADALWDEDLG